MQDRNWMNIKIVWSDWHKMCLYSLLCRLLLFRCRHYFSYICWQVDDIWRYIRDAWVTQFNVLSRPHNDVIKWKHFPRYWYFVRGIHRSLVNSPHKGQWRGAFLIGWINSWVNNCGAGDLRHHHAHYDVIVMINDHINGWVQDCSNSSA